jgi:hypothetical protein
LLLAENGRKIRRGELNLGECFECKLQQQQQEQRDPFLDKLALFLRALNSHIEYHKGRKNCCCKKIFEEVFA